MKNSITFQDILQKNKTIYTITSEAYVTITKDTGKKILLGKKKTIKGLDKETYASVEVAPPELSTPVTIVAEDEQGIWVFTY